MLFIYSGYQSIFFFFFFRDCNKLIITVARSIMLMLTELEDDGVSTVLVSGLPYRALTIDWKHFILSSSLVANDRIEF